MKELSDLINRQEAIKAICEDGTWLEGQGCTDISMAERKQRDADILSDLPSAQSEPQWIPVTERLPEEDVEVLITYRYKEGEGDTSHADIDITTYGQMYFGGNRVGNHKHWRAPFEYFESNYEVVAWMPLPAPWKGETE